MTQGDVAARCGLTFQQIQKYEAGLIAMPIARLIAIADALEAPVADFLHGLPANPQATVERPSVTWAATGDGLAARGRSRATEPARQAPAGELRGVRAR